MQAAGKWGLTDSWDETPAFVAFFGAVFFTALLFWSLVMRLPWLKAGLLSSCVISMVHGSVVSIYGVQLLWQWKSLDLDMPNTPQQVGAPLP